MSQTPFAALATHETTWDKGFLETGDADQFDTNGFPTSGRTRAMEILQNCAPLVISGDQHLSIAVTYDDYGVSDCASPAVINSVWWRWNTREEGKTYVDSFGHEYTLLKVWNAEDSIVDSYTMPKETISAPESVKRARGDGFLFVRFDGENATCEAHSYRDLGSGAGSELMWKAQVPAAVPSSSN